MILSKSKVNFYLCSDDKRKVNKSLALRDSANVYIKENCSMNNPVIICDSSNISNYKTINYFYLSCFGRFYFLNDIVLNNDGLVEISGTVDVLKSFASDIGGLNCFVERSESYYNDEYVDEFITPRITRQISKKVIGNVGTTTGIALTITGGGL